MRKAGLGAIASSAMARPKLLSPKVSTRVLPIRSERTPIGMDVTSAVNPVRLVSNPMKTTEAPSSSA